MGQHTHTHTLKPIEMPCTGGTTAGRLVPGAAVRRRPRDKLLDGRAGNSRKQAMEDTIYSWLQGHIDREEAPFP